MTKSFSTPFKRLKDNNSNNLNVMMMEDREDKKGEPVAIQPEAVNSELLGKEEEQEAMTVQPFEVSFFLLFSFKIKAFINISYFLIFFLFPPRRVLFQ